MSFKIKNKNIFHHVLWTLIVVVTLPPAATLKDLWFRVEGKKIRPNEAVF